MECTEATTKTRGRPREFDPEKALACALRVFWERGYEGASMAELTEAMGITKPSLYSCFGNKEALFKKALDVYERDKLAYVSKALAEPTARAVAEKLLRGALATHCGTSDPQGCLGVVSMVSGGSEAESIRDHLIERRRSSEAAMIERFETARREGDLPASVDAGALARYLTTVLQGLQVKARSGASCAELESVIDLTLACWPAA